MTRRGEAETQIAAFARFAAFVSARFASSSSKVTVRSLLQGGSPLLHLHTVATAASSYSRHCGIFIQSPSLRQWNLFTAASSYSRHCGIFMQSPSLRQWNLFTAYHMRTVALVLNSSSAAGSLGRRGSRTGQNRT